MRAAITNKGLSETYICSVLRCSVAQAPRRRVAWCLGGMGKMQQLLANLADNPLIEKACLSLRDMWRYLTYFIFDLQRWTRCFLENSVGSSSKACLCVAFCVAAQSSMFVRTPAQQVSHKQTRNALTAEPHQIIHMVFRSATKCLSVSYYRHRSFSGHL